MKKILLTLLLLFRFSTVSAMEVVEVETPDESVTTTMVETRNTDDIKPEYRSEEIYETTVLEEEVLEKTEIDEEIYQTTGVEEDIKTTGIVEEENNKDLIIYGLAATTLIASGLAVYFYKKNK